MSNNESDPVTPSASQAGASGSSFYFAMRLLPKAQREAMFAIYKYCRMVDDIADDGTRPRTARARELDAWRADLQALYAGHDGGRAAFLKGVAQRFQLRQSDFLAVVDGMDMDVAADIRAPDLATLSVYCDRVASAVGRLSTRVFGMEEKQGQDLAQSLGHALQLTNILRDLDEDAEIGRLYIPRELLAKAGIDTTDPIAAIADPRIDHACRALAALAMSRFEAANRLLRKRSPGHLLAPRLMTAVYSAILKDMLAAGWQPPRRRIRIRKRRLLWLVARCWIVR
jgi:presqualene diphosphate synthase